MDTFFLGMGIWLSILVVFVLYRVVFDTGVFNRVAAVSAIGTKTLVIILIMGLVYGRVEMFVDISMVYALLNFIACLAAAKYLEMEGE